MKTCENCVYCTRENYCTHREGPYKTWSENHCNNFESKEKDNEIMNEELRKKYGEMTIYDMIEKMVEQEVYIKALEQDGRNYHNELLENRARISDLERAYDRLYEENATFVKKNEALDKRATELVKSVEEKDERIKDLEDRLAIANRSITSYHSEIKKTREKDAELVKSVEEKDEHIEKLKNELDEANAEIGELGCRITERHATNRELYKNCARLETENREKEKNINALQERLNDKDDVIADLEERLEHQKHIISNYERDIVRYSKSDEEKKYLENDISLSKAFYEIGEHVSLGFIDDIKAYCKKCEEEMKPKLSYKCCPEIKKLIDDAGYMRDYMEHVIRGDSSYNLDISSLYPNKFDLNPNADCPDYAARMKAKYDSLIKAGFTEDQAMSLIPMWTDD